ncbi:MAG TPA: GNAT family N-acetyltransferase [Actinomycetota bacterium]|nr:GNAT family N-acetyltransferase [Actinomycetota bacterium]
MYSIRPYAPADRDRLRELVTKDVWAHRPAETFDRRWWWREPEPPLLVAQDTHDGELIGFCAFVPFTLYSKSKTTAAAWYVDFFVSSRHQRKGIGKALTREVMGRFPLTAALWATEGSWAVFQRLGWTDQRFVDIFLNPWPMLPIVGRGMMSRRRRSHPGVRLDVAPIGETLPRPHEIDALWLRVRDGYEALVVRDSATLTARYRQRLGRQYTIMRAYRDSQLAGYMIVRPLPRGSLRPLRRFPVGLVVDYLLDRDDPPLFGLMLDAASARLIAQGSRCVVCLSTERPFHVPLKRRGFLSAGTPLVGRKLSRMRIAFTFFTSGEADRPPSDWMLTFADADSDLTWGSFLE